MSKKGAESVGVGKGDGWLVWRKPTVDVVLLVTLLLGFGGFMRPVFACLILFFACLSRVVC